MLQVEHWETRALPTSPRRSSAAPSRTHTPSTSSSPASSSTRLASGAARAVGNLTDLAVCRGRRDRRVRLDGARQRSDRLRLPYRVAPHPPRRRHRRPQGHRRTRGRRGHGHPGAVQRHRPRRYRLGLRPRRLPAGAGLRLVRRHPAPRRLRHALLPHGQPSARQRRATRSRPVSRSAGPARPVTRPDPTCTSRRTSTAVKPKTRRSIQYGSCRTWEHPSEPRRDEL